MPKLANRRSPGPKALLCGYEHRQPVDVEELTNAQSMRLLSEEPVAHLALVSDGEPYVTPISFVHANRQILFRTGPGRRLTALKTGDKVCIEVSRYSSDNGDWESVILWGTPRVVEDPGQEAEAIGLLLVKYRKVFGSALAFSKPNPLAPQEVVVGVEVETMSGRSSGAGFAPRTRPGRL